MRNLECAPESIAIQSAIAVDFTLYKIKLLVIGWFSEKVYQGGGDHVRECITHLLSIKNSNVDDFHVSIAINI